MQSLRIPSASRLSAAILSVALVFCSSAASAQGITQILDATGDGVNDFRDPEYQSLVVDLVGNVYVTGRTSDNVFRIKPDGTVEQVIDESSDGVNQLLAPNGIAVDGAGNVYVVGTDSNNVFKIEPGGVITQIIDVDGDGTHPLTNPYYLCVTTTGTVYVTGYVSNNLFKIEPSGDISQIMDASGDGVNPVEGMNSVALDDAGNLYATGFDSHNAFKIAPDGTITQIIDAAGDGVNDLASPEGLACDTFGNVFIAGSNTDNAFRVEPDGNIVQIIDPDGDGVSGLGSPVGLATTHSGAVFVAGSVTDNVFEIMPGGAITEVIDLLGDGESLLVGPYAVATSFCGNLFVSGEASENVFRVDRLGGEVEPDFRLGSKLVGEIEVEDTDEFSFYATAGTRLTIVARATGKGVDPVLIPSFTVTGPDEATLATSVLKGKAARINKVVVETTGLHVVSLSGINGSGGTYLVKTKGKFPSKVNEIVEVGSDGGFALFDGIPGMTIKSLRVKAMAPKGDFADVGGTPSDLRPQVTALIAPCGASTPLGELTTNKSGKAVTGRNILLLASGTQRLDIEGGESVGFAKVVAKLKVDKVKTEVSEKE